MLPAVAKQLGPELTAFFRLRLAHCFIVVAHGEATIRLIYTAAFCRDCEEGSDLASLHAYVAKEEESLRRKYPRR